jgi:macrolide phosphotransferase
VAIPDAGPTVTVATIPPAVESETPASGALDPSPEGTAAAPADDAKDEETKTGAEAGDSHGTGNADDTSTAAISVVKVTPLHTANRF